MLVRMCVCARVREGALLRGELTVLLPLRTLYG